MLYFLVVLLILIILAAIASALVLLSRRKTKQIEAFARSQIEPAGAFADIDGTRLHYIDRGQGPPIVFLHGLGGNLLNFVPTLFPLLQDEFRLIALDRAGSGFSAARADGSGALPDHADLVAGLMDHLGIDKAVIVGHSLGGAIALQMALRHPERVEALALIAPLTHVVEDRRGFVKALYIPSDRRRRFIADTFAVPAVAKNGDASLALIFGPQHAPDDFATEGGGYVSLFPSHFHASSTDLTALPDHLPDQETRYGEIGVPLGILYGTGDRILDATDTRPCLRRKISADGIGPARGHRAHAAVRRAGTGGRFHSRHRHKGRLTPFGIGRAFDSARRSRMSGSTYPEKPASPYDGRSEKRETPHERSDHRRRTDKAV